MPAVASETGLIAFSYGKAFDGLRMSADFTPNDFWAATPKERVLRCRQMAIRAEQLAAKADGKSRSDYVELARQWRALAAELATWGRTFA